MVVTGVERISTYRVKITLDEERSLILSAREAASFGMEEGREIDPASWEALLAQQRSAAIAKCGKLLQGMDYSAAGLKDKLLRSGFLEEAAQEAVEKMQEAHYVDDARYAATYLKYHLHDRSLSRIRMDLRAKGVPGEIVEQEIRRLEEEDEGTVKSREVEQAKKLLTKRHFDPDNPDPAIVRKQMAYLYGKGYGMEVIRQAMEELAEASEDPE